MRILESEVPPKVTFKQGHKHPDDKIVFYKNTAMTYYDWMLMGLQFFLNEERIYPRPRFQGGYYLLKAFIEICLKGRMCPKTLKKYKIPHGFSNEKIKS